MIDTLLLQQSIQDYTDRQVARLNLYVYYLHGISLFLLLPMVFSNYNIQEIKTCYQSQCVLSVKSLLLC